MEHLVIADERACSGLGMAVRSAPPKAALKPQRGSRRLGGWAVDGRKVADEVGRLWSNVLGLFMSGYAQDAIIPP